MNASLPDSLRIAELIRKQLQSELSTEEKAELDRWIASDESHERLFDELNNAAMLKQEAASFARFDEEKALTRFLEKNGQMDPADIQPTVRRIGPWKWAAAAAVIMILSVCAYLWIAEKPQGPPLVSKPEQKDVAPGKKGATLILANGTQVLLDSLQNGLVADQSGMQAILQNGQLVYRPGEEAIGEMVYNTISVPNGRVFHLILPDGTKVWINSASTIRYPVAFTGNQRQVDITGEAYFDVAKNMKKPFRVRIENKAEIEVLGTQFNINAYENEESLNTTLLEGSVRVLARTAGPWGDQFTQVLTPGQQLQLSEKGTNITEPDIEKTIAWKNGLFNFDGVELKNAMKQIARWYDVEIVYKGKVPDVKFYGKISRDISLAGLIKGFEGSGVHMAIENGKQLVVMP